MLKLSCSPFDDLSRPAPPRQPGLLPALILVRLADGCSTVVAVPSVAAKGTLAGSALAAPFVPLGLRTRLPALSLCFRAGPVTPHPIDLTPALTGLLNHRVSSTAMH